jgi:glycerophosphoryl diester phosphodiesterase
VQNLPVIPRQRPLTHPQLLFASKGASAHAPENTVEAFRLAVRLGATGIDSTVWLTQDHIAVLAHDGKFGRVRRRRINEATKAELPDFIPTLDALYETVGNEIAVSLTLTDIDSAESVLAIARAHRAGERLWLGHSDLDALTALRPMAGSSRLFHPTTVRAIGTSVERHAALLRERQIDALRLPRDEWTGGHVAMLHRFGRLVFADDAQHEHHLSDLFRMGADAVFSNYVDRMVDAHSASEK